ncbi:hypothetical protein POMI540_0054 [Schizosaccharomyces pombe]
MPPVSKNTRTSSKTVKKPYDPPQGSSRPFFTVLKRAFSSVLHPFTSGLDEKASGTASKDRKSGRAGTKSLLTPELTPHYLGKSPRIIRVSNRSHVRTIDGIEEKVHTNTFEPREPKQKQDYTNSPTLFKRHDELSLKSLNSLHPSSALSKKLGSTSQHQIATPKSSASLLNILRSLHDEQKNTLNISSVKQDRITEANPTREKRKPSRSPSPILSKKKSVARASENEPSAKQNKSFSGNDSHKSLTDIRDKENGETEVSAKNHVPQRSSRRRRRHQRLIPIIYETLEQMDLRKPVLVNAEVQTDSNPGNTMFIDKQDIYHRLSTPTSRKRQTLEKGHIKAFSAVDEDLDEIFACEDDVHYTALPKQNPKSERILEPIIASPKDNTSDKGLLTKSAPTFEELQASITPKPVKTSPNDTALTLAHAEDNKTFEHQPLSKDTEAPKSQFSSSPTKESTTRKSEVEPPSPSKEIKSSQFSVPEFKFEPKTEATTDKKLNVPKFEFKPTATADVQTNRLKENEPKPTFFAQLPSKTQETPSITENKPSFFSQLSPKREETEKKDNAPSAPASTSGFSFGGFAPKTLEEKAETKAPTFNFSLNNASSTQDTTKPTLQFNFGSSFGKPTSNIFNDKKTSENGLASSTAASESKLSAPESKPSSGFGNTAGSSPFSFNLTKESKEVPPTNSFSFAKKGKDEANDSLLAKASTPFSFAKPNTENVTTTAPQFSFNFTKPNTDAKTNLLPEKTFNEEAVKQKETEKEVPPTGPKASEIKDSVSSNNAVPSSTFNFVSPFAAVSEKTNENNIPNDTTKTNGNATKRTLEQTEDAKPFAFSFGSTTEQANKKASTSNETTKPQLDTSSKTDGVTANAPFSFASAFNAPKPSTNTADGKDSASNLTTPSPAFSFGNNSGVNASSNNNPSTNSSTAPFSFGTSNKPAFSFGSATSKTTSEGTAPAASAPAPAPTTSAFSFGASNSSMNKEENTPMAKDAGDTAPASGFKSGFSFGANNSPQPASMFGTSTPAPSSAFAFGNQSGTNPAAPAGFGGITNTATNNPPSTGFTFTPSNAGSTAAPMFGAGNTPNPSGSINNASQAFAFGSGEPSNPPSNPPSTGFSFGAATPSAFNASASQSPAPNGIQFNLGSSNSQTNAPPGRKIAVPRSRRKR